MGFHNRPILIQGKIYVVTWTENSEQKKLTFCKQANAVTFLNRLILDYGFHDARLNRVKA